MLNESGRHASSVSGHVAYSDGLVKIVYATFADQGKLKTTFFPNRWPAFVSRDMNLCSHRIVLCNHRATLCKRRVIL